MTRAIWWLRRDLRLSDNQALKGALNAGGQVIPVFILDPKLLASPYVGEARLAFLLASLRTLDGELARRGSYLVFRKGDPLVELERLAAETGATAIFAEADYSPYARRRDEVIDKYLPVHWQKGLVVHPPASVLKTDGEPYAVFTPFRKAWMALVEPTLQGNFEPPAQIPTPVGIKSEPVPFPPSVPENTLFPPGEFEAQRRLRAFIASVPPVLAPVYMYARDRDRPDLDGTSRLSPYLRFGMLSIRQVVAAAFRAIHLAPDEEARQGAQIWLNELVWREFYFHILYHFPRVRGENFRLKRVNWVNDKGHFDAWRQGQTGYPAVDAAMRQLTQTGWMHNRSRMIVASFLCKDLLVDWRWGESWFMQCLLDGDPAANNGGWQWTAGTGTDAAPYFRIFNPVTQSKRYDPGGAYIRRWLPELAHIPDKFVHEPWKMPDEFQRQAGCVIGKDYPFPIVEHAWARERALQFYARAKE
jgi:deoxyribodipyrimidine photo-lyase